VIQEIIDEFLAKRKQARWPKLGWRVSRGPRRSLGWIPFTNQDVEIDGSIALLRGRKFRFLEYKCDHAGVACAEVNEADTTQACSECLALGGPHGREGLAVRQWVCSECGSIHDRDQNAALNIARLGCETLGLKGPGSLVL
jgi:hypothetical protein